MKTAEDLWRWIWEDEDLLDEKALRDIPLDGQAPEHLPGAASEALWEWIASDEELIDRSLLEFEVEAVEAPPPSWPESPAASYVEPEAPAADTAEVAPPAAPEPTLAPRYDELTEMLMERLAEAPPAEPLPAPLEEPVEEWPEEPREEPAEVPDELAVVEPFEPAPEEPTEAVEAPELPEEPPEEAAELWPEEPHEEPAELWAEELPEEAPEVRPEEPFEPAELWPEEPHEEPAELWPEDVPQEPALVLPEAEVETPSMAAPEDVKQSPPPVPVEEIIKEIQAAPAPPIVPVAKPAEPLVERPRVGVSAPAFEARPEAPAPPPPGRLGRVRSRWPHLAALVAVVAVVGVVAPRVLPAIVSDDAGSPAVAPPPDQHVVAWTVRVNEVPDSTFVAVLASGAKPPVAVAIPADVTINLPGQGLGTVGEAAAGGDTGLVEVSLENLLGVRVDASVDSTSLDLQALVDALGTIEVADDQMIGGAQAVEYLSAIGPGSLPDERFLRWQDVLDGILRAAAARPDAVSGFAEPLATALRASSPKPADLYALPVVDHGAGLLWPDQEALDTLVRDRFLETRADEIRLVVLNGVGNPGIGEEVASILVPEGYRLMDSGNADTFEHRLTKIVASSESTVPAAEQTRALLGVGKVVLGFQPTGLADLTVVVGRDFVTAQHPGGA